MEPVPKYCPHRAAKKSTTWRRIALPISTRRGQWFLRHKGWPTKSSLQKNRRGLPALSSCMDTHQASKTWPCWTNLMLAALADGRGTGLFRLPDQPVTKQPKPVICLACRMPIPSCPYACMHCLPSKALPYQSTAC